MALPAEREQDGAAVLERVPAPDELRLLEVAHPPQEVGREVPGPLVVGHQDHDLGPLRPQELEARLDPLGTDRGAPVGEELLEGEHLDSPESRREDLRRLDRPGRIGGDNGDGAARNGRNDGARELGELAAPERHQPARFVVVGPMSDHDQLFHGLPSMW